MYRSCGAAHWAIWPSRSTATRSAMDNASSWSWVTRMAVVPGGPEDLLHVGPDAGPQVRIQRRERLVQQDQLRLDGQRPGQGDALLLAARQLVRVALAQPGQADGLQQLADARAAPRSGLAGRSRRWPPRSGAGTGCLPAARSRSGAARAARARRARRRSTAPICTVPASACSNPASTPQQRGLAAAGRAQDRGQRPGRHGQVQPGQDRRGAEGLVQPLHGQLGHAVYPRATRSGRRTGRARSSARPRSAIMTSANGAA